MEKSESIAEITKALVEFHKQVGSIHKGSANPFYKSKYAALPDILEVVDPILVANGLIVTQFPVGENGLYTLVAHTSGEWMGGLYDMKPKDNTPQGQGSVVTYQRRYALGAVLGLNINEDDDGNAASKVSNPIREAAATVKPKTMDDVKTVFSADVSDEPVEFVIDRIQETDDQGFPLTTKTGKAYRRLETTIGSLFYFDAHGLPQIGKKYTGHMTSKAQGTKVFHTITDIKEA